ncbi:MAG: aryl-sulfate sulfotransferase [Chitinophagaceae bacterium]
MKGTKIAALSFAAITLIYFSSCKKNTQIEDVIKYDTVATPTSLDTSSQGYIMMSPFSSPLDSGNLIVMDGSGKVLKQKRTAYGAMNLRRWVVNGQVRYTYCMYDPSTYVIPVINNYCFTSYIADSNLNVIKTIGLIAHGDITTGQNQSTDLHDFIYIADNHYYTLSYYLKTATNVPANLAPNGNPQVVCPVIQEVLNDQVVWQWEATDFPEFYTTSVESNNFSDVNTPHDYMHLNSMILDPSDNNLIISCRNLDQVFKINHTTGAIMWRLGGSNSDFPVSDYQQSLRQHYASLTDNGQTLMIFDNGLAGVRESTRILEFQLNESAKTINGFRAFNVPEPYSQIMGSVQKYGTHYFISGGSAKYYLEVNYLTGQKYKEVINPLQSYRILRSMQ